MEEEKDFTQNEENLVIKTLYEMMEDRGYPDPPQIKPDLYIFSRPPLPTFEVRIFKEPKIGIGHIKNFIYAGCSRYIFISSSGITPKARKTSKNYQFHKVFIETFLIAELLFNVTKHVYCPTHRLCSAQEMAEVLKNLGVSSTEKYDKLPCILTTDPIMRYYGIRHGNLMEITRDSVTMPGYPEITYRIVRPDSIF